MGLFVDNGSNTAFQFCLLYKTTTTCLTIQMLIPLAEKSLGLIVPVKAVLMSPYLEVLPQGLSTLTKFPLFIFICPNKVTLHDRDVLYTSTVVLI